MVRIKHILYKSLVAIIVSFIGGFFLINPPTLFGAYSAPPLLLSLDVEKNGDVESLSILNLQEPATYFVTGKFALSYPETVRKLATRGTIGSHSHAHLQMKELEADLVRQDLLASSKAIEAATGKAPVWFRAPFLEFNTEILRTAYELGFRYDSSMSERWVQQQIMSEFPISMNSTGRILFSDYNIFSTYGLASEMALDMLKENYLDRTSTGRPFIFLLHPSIISQHKDLLYRFIDFVKQQGGICMSFDQYLDQFSKTKSATLGIHLDPLAGKLDVKNILSDFRLLGVTDVFINMQNLYFNDDQNNIREVSHPGNDKTLQLVNALKDGGFRVHGSLNALYHPPPAQNNIQDTLMVDRAGNYLSSWLSPSSPSTHNLINNHISDILSTFPLDGIHLQYLAYPSLEYDYSPRALSQFTQENSLTPNKQDPTTILTDYYNEWTSWRISQLSEVVQSAAATISLQDKSIQLSASLNPTALTNYREMEISGQDYRILANVLDLFIMEPYGSEDPDKSFSDFSGLSRAMIGKRPLLINFPAGDEHPWTELNFRNFLIEREFSSPIMQGVILPNYNNHISKIPEGTQEFENLYDVIQTVGTPPTSSLSAAPLVTANQPLGEERTPPPDLTKKGVSSLANTRAELHPVNKLLPLILSAGIVLVSIVLIVSYLYRKSSLEKPLDLEKTAIIDWRQMDKSIVDGQINGALVHSVAKHLRKYDPVEVSKYRNSFILSIVANSSKEMSVNELMSIDFDVPGWQILAMSHLKEALMHNYLQLSQDKIIITKKGLDEFNKMTEKGFTPDQWAFIEKRLHENLIVSCPYCSAENTAHWYWPNFTCSSCNQDVSFRECNSIIENKSPGIELDQHNFS